MSQLEKETSGRLAMPKDWFPESDCRWCGQRHSGVCPRIKSIEYDTYGNIIKVEFR